MKGEVQRLAIVLSILSFLVLASSVSGLNQGNEINFISTNSNVDDNEINPLDKTLDITGDQLNLRWTIDLENYAPMMKFSDMDLDGYLELVTETTSSDYLSDALYCINTDDGSVRWKHEHGLRSSSFSIGDLDKDGYPEIVTSSYAATVYNRHGSFLWRAESIRFGSSYVSVVDIDENGIFDIISYGDGDLARIDRDGTVDWYSDFSYTYQDYIAISNLDKTGAGEIILALRDGSLVCVNHAGNTLWTKNFGSTNYYWQSQPVIADVDSSAGNEILISNDIGELLCLDSSGNKLWDYYHSKWYVDVEIADLNNDSVCEIILFDTETIICLDSSGSKLWEVSAIFPNNPNIAIADLDNDGNCEIITGREHLGMEEIICYNHLGQELWTKTVGSSYITEVAVIDTDLNGVLELFISQEISEEYSAFSRITCYDITGITKSGKQPVSGKSTSNYNTRSADHDGDFLDDTSELILGSNPTKSDTDLDGIIDGMEIIFGLKTNVDDTIADFDGDGVSNYDELYIHHSYYRVSDSDGDGINDYHEVSTYLTNPMKADTDQDGLTDFEEIFTHLTDPLDFDSDDDLIADGWEITYGFDPFLNDSYLDHDNDSLTAYYEFLANSNPYLNDSDSDLLSDYDEYFIYGTNPGDPNTDGDRMDDLWEVTWGTDPFVDDSMEDPDVDFLKNMEEQQIGTDPLNADTDGDGWSDGDEYLFRDTDPLDPNDYPHVDPTSVHIGITLPVISLLLVGFSIGIFIIRKRLRKTN